MGLPLDPLNATQDGFPYHVKQARAQVANGYGQPKQCKQALHNALKALTEDEVVKAALGDHIYTSFLEAKRIEWASYATFVSQWEVDNYLDLY